MFSDITFSEINSSIIIFSHIKVVEIMFSKITFSKMAFSIIMLDKIIFSHKIAFSVNKFFKATTYIQIRANMGD